MFMSYMHQNYTPFCDAVEDCVHLMSYMSDADALMRMEGDNFSRHALTSHYSFQVSVRGGLMSLPSPIQRRGQKMYKSEMWAAQKRERENFDTVLDWMAILTKERQKELDANASRLFDAAVKTAQGNLAMQEIGEREGMGDLLPNKLNLLLEFLPFQALMQAPQRSFTAFTSATSSCTANGNIFAKPARPSSLNQSTTPHASFSSSSNKTAPKKLSKALLEIAFMPPPQIASAGTALNEKDIPEEAEEDEMKMKPVAPAVKVEPKDEEEGERTEEEMWKELLEEEEDEDIRVEKLYLSDDDIDDF